MPATAGTLPVYMRIGNDGEAQIGAITLDIDQALGTVTLTAAAVADALRAAADEIDPPRSTNPPGDTNPLDPSPPT